MADLDDLTAIRMVAAGGAAANKAMAWIFERYFRRIGKHLRMKFPSLSEDDAADIAVKSLMKAFAAAETYRGDAALPTWLLGIAVNLAKDDYRHQAVVPMISADASEEAAYVLANAAAADTPLSEAERKQLMECVRKHFETFRSNHPQPAWALWARHVEEMGAQEISTILSKTYGATRQYLSDWAQKLKVLLTPCYEHLRVG